jgi:putative hemolysin
MVAGCIMREILIDIICNHIGVRDEVLAGKIADEILEIYNLTEK